jgi:hypothetical protein
MIAEEGTLILVVGEVREGGGERWSQCEAGMAGSRRVLASAASLCHHASDIDPDKI